MNYYRVRIGFGKDDFISVDQEELATAIRAQVTGKVAVLKEGTVSGNHIMSIVPDLQRSAGYNRDYQLTGEDYERLQKVHLEHRKLFLETKEDVVIQMLGATKKLPA